MLLAEKLVTKIVDSGPITIDQLDARAVKLGIDMNVLDQALQHVHKCKSIERKVLKGTLTYSYKKVVVKKKEYFTSTVPYPPSDETNNADHPIFASMNFDYLFLKPEELERYKAESKGRVYIPKKRYKRKAKVVSPPTPIQQSLIDMFKTSV